MGTGKGGAVPILWHFLFPLHSASLADLPRNCSPSSPSPLLLLHTAYTLVCHQARSRSTAIATASLQAQGCSNSYS